MSEERYQKWREAEYGRQAGPIREANQISLEEAERIIMEKEEYEDER